jgi:hypothetical protein
MFIVINSDLIYIVARCHIIPSYYLSLSFHTAVSSTYLLSGTRALGTQLPRH